MDFATDGPAEFIRNLPQTNCVIAIAAQHGLTRDHVLVTHAGDEALRLAITTFVEPGGTLGTHGA